MGHCSSATSPIGQVRKHEAKRELIRTWTCWTWRQTNWNWNHPRRRRRGVASCCVASAGPFSSRFPSSFGTSLLLLATLQDGMNCDWRRRKEVVGRGKESSGGSSACSKLSGRVNHLEWVRLCDVSWSGTSSQLSARDTLGRYLYAAR